VNDAKNNTATATTDTADVPPERRYTGRFAPSPTGDLHLGSVYAAAASYLDARAHGGRWLLRLEDLDVPRVVAGSAAGILKLLDRFGFQWDGEVVYQSTRTDRYLAALETLRLRGLTFECSCSRSQLADEERYPGHCRAAPLVTGVPTAIRLCINPGHIQFADRIQGTFRQDVDAAVGDVVLRRRDQLFAYVLAVVVDDDAQGVTHIVRGADLLDNTPRQIHLQRLLGLRSPTYAHVPVLVEADGSKLAKSARSMRADAATVVPQLLRVFTLLNLSPPPALVEGSAEDAWKWAFQRWRVGAVAPRLTLPLGA
jgi:glutamyl-Q tRNA(Asp) synthetase